MGFTPINPKKGSSSGIAPHPPSSPSNKFTGLDLGGDDNETHGDDENREHDQNDNVEAAKDDNARDDADQNDNDNAPIFSFDDEEGEDEERPSKGRKLSARGSPAKKHDIPLPPIDRYKPPLISIPKSQQAINPSDICIWFPGMYVPNDGYVPRKDIFRRLKTHIDIHRLSGFAEGIYLQWSFKDVVGIRSALRFWAELGVDGSVQAFMEKYPVAVSILQVVYVEASNGGLYGRYMALLQSDFTRRSKGLFV